MPPSHQIQNRPSGRGIVVSALLAVLSFSAGLLLASLSPPMFKSGAAIRSTCLNKTSFDNSMMSHRLSNETPDQQSPTERNQNHSSGLDENPLRELPLGLQWYRMAYENPWRASVERIGIDDLLTSVNQVVERDGKLPRVVVSFTSLPKRFIKHARAMIEILKKQSYLPDTIYVCIPRDSRRSDADFKIPTWIRDDPLIKVLRPEIDMGPATKLIPVIDAELELGNTDTRIITVDDDNEGNWGKDSLLSLYVYSIYYADAAIGFTGWNVTCMTSDSRCSPEDSGVPQRQYPDRMYNFIKQADDYACHTLSDWLPDYYANCLGAIRKNFIGYADVIEGYKGALYQPRFFDVEQLKTLMDRTKTPEYFFLCDDVWFSGWLSVKDVPRIITNPAIHEDAKVRLQLMALGDKRNFSRELLPMPSEERIAQGRLTGIEGALHGMGNNFVQANHDGVKWFESKGGWTEGMWRE